MFLPQRAVRGAYAPTTPPATGLAYKVIYYLFVRTIYHSLSIVCLLGLAPIWLHPLQLLLFVAIFSVIATGWEKKLISFQTISVIENS